MRQIGSQTREKIENTEYKVSAIEGNETTGRNAILLRADGKEELWTENDDFAGYVIEIDGAGYEFVRDMKV
jgi:hypothetical protein